MTAADQSRASRQRPALNGLRGFALLLVVGYHMGPTWLPGSGVALEIFFVLSGYLITEILWRDLERTGRISLRAFYWRRIIRLAPALVVSLCLVFPLVAICLGEQRHILSNTLMVLFYVYDLTAAQIISSAPPVLHAYWHTWSLAAQEQFYLVCPFVLLALHRFAPRRRLLLVVLAVVAGFAVLVVSTATLGRTATFYLPMGHLPSLIAGVGLAVAERQGAIGATPTLRVQVLGTICFAGVLLVSVIHRQPSGVWTSSALYLGWCALAVGLVRLAGLRAAGDPVSRLLAWQPMQYLGVRSYGGYLYHSSLVHLPGRYHWRPHIPAQLAVLGGSLVLAHLSYRYLESPVRDWGRDVLNRHRAARLPARPIAPVTSPGIATPSATRLDGRSDPANPSR